MKFIQDGAAKAKEVAEKKLSEKDFVGAKEFALKAFKLFPGLEGLSALLDIINVYVAYDKRLCGEADWYGILGVDPSADHETMKRQYKKLALSIHPDKNRTSVAEGAFKILTEAWSLLYDKAKRFAYDQRLCTQQQGGRNRATTDVDKALGRKLPSTSNMGTSEFPWVGSTSAVKIQPGSLPNPGDVRSAPRLATSAIQAASHLQQASANMKKGHEESAKNAVSRSAQGNKSNRPEKKQQVAPESGGCEQSNLCKDQRGTLGAKRIAVPQPTLRTRLMQKAQMEFCMKLHKHIMTAASEEEKKKRTAPDTAIGISVGCAMKAGNMNSVVNNSHDLHQSQNTSVSVAHGNLNVEDSDFVTMAVPDPDFHDFDDDRVENSFAENQVWAAYDDDDGMPRIYTYIHEVISRNPFKVWVSQLYCKTNIELSPQNGIGSGFYKTCGEFKRGQHQIHKMLSSFSHIVNWREGVRGILHIYPKKGDTWALYSNWSSDWSMLTPEEVVHKYDMVEVLEDYNEREGVLVAPLIKVAGFKSVFRQHKDQSKAWTITSEEMFRFSHQVPSFLLTGQEAQNAPAGCRELDPAAMPAELLQVLKETEVEDAVEGVEPRALADEFVNQDKGTSGEVTRRFREPPVTYVRKKNRKKVAVNNDEAKEETLADA